jgi:hypothetical protein
LLCRHVVRACYPGLDCDRPEFGVLRCRRNVNQDGGLQVYMERNIGRVLEGRCIQGQDLRWQVLDIRWLTESTEMIEWIDEIESWRSSR